MSLHYKKTAMVLYALERAFGEYLGSFGESLMALGGATARSISERERSKGVDLSEAEDVIQAAYLSELVDMMICVNRDSSAAESVQHIKRYFEELDIYQVRNAIAHPNRLFIDAYWYRVAAIATDPALDRIGILDVKAQVKVAEEGLISDPPEEWISTIQHVVRNNIPAAFDHAITGLIGRSKDSKKILDAIFNPRLNCMAIVGPGGLGKTALLLDVLDTVCSDTKSAAIFDGVVFITLKTERLTAKGLEEISSSRTISELKRQISKEVAVLFSENEPDDFEEAINRFSAKKILLCVDNLETLLSEDQDSFSRLNNALPAAWKVIVTSRIDVHGAACNPLEPLSIDYAAQLAFKYASMRASLEISYAVCRDIAQSCACNPLAIRLSIDAISNGAEVSVAISKTVTSVLEFSFKNLIDRLSENDIKVIEAVFVIGDASRSDIEAALDMPRDALNDSLYRLARTSLLVRRFNGNDDHEKFMIVENARGLILSAPYGLSIRNSIIEKLNSVKNAAREVFTIQKEEGIEKFDEKFIDPTISPDLMLLINGAWKSLRKGDHSLILAAYSAMQASEISNRDSKFYQRVMGRLLSALGDRPEAERRYRLALDVDADDPVTRMMLSSFYFSQKSYELAFRENEILYRGGWDNPENSTDAFARKVMTSYFVSMLYLNMYERVLEETKKWKDHPYYRGLLGVYRASAFKRSVEVIVTRDVSAGIPALRSAVRILNDVFSHDGYFQNALSEASKIFSEIVFILSRFPASVDGGIIREWLIFLEAHMVPVLSGRQQRKIGEYVAELRASSIPSADNVFHDKKWDSFLMSLPDSDIDLSGKVVVRVTNIDPLDKGYCFGISDAGESYFIHFNEFDGISKRDWGLLDIGDKLFCTPDRENSKGANIRASKCALLRKHERNVSRIIDG